MISYDFSKIGEVQLSSGSHQSPEQGMCFMEMTAWFAGEKHSDKPACACPILGSYGITLNDNMPDEMRDRLLKPLVPLIAGTRGSLHDDLADACEAAKSIDDLAALAALAALADLAARADLADLARDQILELMVEGLGQAILIGPHEGFDVTVDLAARHEALRELVGA